jgi:Fe-S-cluster-containing hydrogenase component 2
MRYTRNIIEINEELCNGCGACAIACAEGAIRIIDDKARLVSDKYCDGLGACLGDCPTGAIKIVQREADEFEETSDKLNTFSKVANLSHQGCPGSRVHNFVPQNPSPSDASSSSALTHWPVQIRLVPPDAPFLEEADLLIAADCAPVSCANFHRDFLSGKVVMIGCPKFDDADFYSRRFIDIFKTACIKSITVLAMKVPCCQGLPLIVREALIASGRKIPAEKVTLSLQGEVISREEL